MRDGERLRRRWNVKVNRRKRLFDGAGEATLTMLAYSTLPLGHASWSFKLPGEHLVTLEIVDVISKETVRQTWKRAVSSLC